MAPLVTEIIPPVPESESGRLRNHLPQSLPLLRRIQFTHYPQGTTEHARYLIATDSDGAIDGGDSQGQPPSQRHFAAAYLDLSKGPETEMYLYTTLEDAKDIATVPNEEVERVLDLAVALLHRGKLAAEEVMRSGAFKLARGAGFLVGGLHQPTYELLCSRRGITSSYWNPHHAWLFRMDRLPALPGGDGGGPGPGLRWDVVRREDVPLIASRTYIPKIEATLMSEPSVGVRDADGTLVAWGFIGVAGTLSTLHVEVRGRGDREEAWCVLRDELTVCRNRTVGRAWLRPLLRRFCGSTVLVMMAGVSNGTILHPTHLHVLI